MRNELLEIDYRWNSQHLLLYWASSPFYPFSLCAAATAKTTANKTRCTSKLIQKSILWPLKSLLVTLFAHWRNATIHECSFWLCQKRWLSTEIFSPKPYRISPAHQQDMKMCLERMIAILPSVIHWDANNESQARDILDLLANEWIHTPTVPIYHIHPTPKPA